MPREIDLEALAREVRRVWSPPAGRAWSHGDLAMIKLLTAIEGGAVPKLEAAARKGILEAAIRSFEGQEANPAFDADHRRAAGYAARDMKREWKLQLEGATWDPRT